MPLSQLQTRKRSDDPRIFWLQSEDTPDPSRDDQGVAQPNGGEYEFKGKDGHMYWVSADRGLTVDNLAETNRYYKQNLSIGKGAEISPLGDVGVRKDFAIKMAEQTNSPDFFSRLGPGILALPFIAAFAGSSLAALGSSGASATAAEFAAADAAQLSAQGLGQAQIASTLEASGLSAEAAAEAASLASQGMTAEQIQQSLQTQFPTLEYNPSGTPIVDPVDPTVDPAVDPLYTPPPDQGGVPTPVDPNAPIKGPENPIVTGTGTETGAGTGTTTGTGTGILPQWMTDLGITPSLLATLVGGGISAYGNYTSADNLQGIADRQEGQYTDARNAYNDMVNLQAGAWNADMGRYDTNVTNNLGAYGNAITRYDDMVNLQAGAWNRQMGNYDANVSSQNDAYDTSVGMYNQQNQQQMDAYDTRQGQYDTELARQSALGSPYRDKLSALYDNPDSFLTSKEVTVPVQQGTNILAKSLSIGGNPVGSGNALQELQNYASDKLFGKLGDEKTRLGSLGGLTGAAYQSPTIPAAPPVMQSYPQLNTPSSQPGIPSGPSIPNLPNPGSMPGIPSGPQYPSYGNFSGATNANTANSQLYGGLGAWLSRLMNQYGGTSGTETLGNTTTGGVKPSNNLSSLQQYDPLTAPEYNSTLGSTSTGSADTSQYEFGNPSFPINTGSNLSSLQATEGVGQPIQSGILQPYGPVKDDPEAKNKLRKYYGY